MKTIKLLSLSALMSAVLAACGTAIPPEQYGDYAFIISGVADGPYRCDPGTPSCSVFIGYVDGKVQGLAAPKVVVKPGLHTFELGVRPLAARYRFVALAGHRYILEQSRILVSLRSDPNQTVIDELAPYGDEYISAKDAKSKADAQVQAEESAFRERHTIDMPKIRKIGAEVCLNAPTARGNVQEHGYVEAVGDNKIKIRVDGGRQGDHEIWDFPDSWLLCGHN
ncbi:hypothetical protein [Paraburkholderia sediminicola]|uniref:hypothetical protein n=1 Tax=Paraburkholderia sediminicola TaxID=458836 RepID=UPI0038B74277